MKNWKEEKGKIMNKRDALGDRMKSYESTETSRKLMKYLPIYARLDGKAFHNFTRGMERPFDNKFKNLMVEVTKFLVKEFGASFGYTQSDEISLGWYFPEIKSQPPLGGKIQKLNSVLAGKASSKLMQLVIQEFPEKADSIPCFDCRIINLPNLTEACNMLIWREKDAVKNSISMAASTVYSDKELFGKSGNQRQEMLFQKGINWNEYPVDFKRGSWVLRSERLVNPEELVDIPEKYRPKEPVVRKIVERVEIPILTKIENLEGVLFNGEAPKKKEE